jgi:hypothetical protein
LRWLGLASALGVVLFVLLWLANGQTEEGNVAYLGLEEGDWRALLNPVLAVWLVTAWAWRMRLRGLARAGAVVLALGLALALVGNVLEFGFFGEAFLGSGPSWDGGWIPYLLGTLVAAVGLVLVGATSLTRRVA